MARIPIVQDDVKMRTAVGLALETIGLPWDTASDAGEPCTGEERRTA